VAQLRGEYPLAVICRVMQLPRSGVYARDRNDVVEQNASTTTGLRAHIEQIATTWPTYGYRRMTAQLRREAEPICGTNSKRVRRLMRELGVMGQAPKRRQCRTTNSEHPYPRYPNLVRDLRVDHPDHVWVGDITYVRLRLEFVYLAVLMDVFTRAIRGWELTRSLDQALTLTALERALEHGHIPQIHHSDQGVQYAATAYVACLEQVGARISMAAVGEPRQNGYAERLMRTIKEEEVDLTEYEDFTDAYAHLGQFLDDVYQRKRIHSALGYLTPAEFESAWQTAQHERQSIAIP
jgi:putative transposase